jgi:hypothetical protein
VNYESRYEVQGATQQWVDSFMQQYHITATDMIDSLNNVLVKLKDKAVEEMFQQVYQQRAMTMQQQAAAQNKEEGMTDGETDIPN